MPHDTYLKQQPFQGHNGKILIDADKVTRSSYIFNTFIIFTYIIYNYILQL